jgi:hypothetical protein
MRTILVGTLSVILAGCSCLNSPQAMLEGCTSQVCFDRTAAATPLEITPAPFTPSPATRAKPKRVAKTTAPLSAKPATDAGTTEEKTNSPVIMKPETPPSDQPSEISRPALKKPRPAIPAKMDIAGSGQAAETADPVLKKAKTTIAAKMEDPASAEFEDMKRAMRKNTFGQPVDTICGHVKGKKTSGEEIGERPFLYLVKEDEAYVADGNPESAAATAYRNICINLDIRGKESRQQQSRE